MVIKVSMTDIGNKEDTLRKAVAVGTLHLKRESICAIQSGRVRKGDVIAVAQVAGIQAAKNTWNFIPLCHQIPLTHVHLEIRTSKEHVKCTCTVTATYRTGGRNGSTSLRHSCVVNSVGHGQVS